MYLLIECIYLFIFIVGVINIYYFCLFIFLIKNLVIVYVRANFSIFRLVRTRDNFFNFIKNVTFKILSLLFSHLKMYANINADIVVNGAIVTPLREHESVLLRHGNFMEVSFSGMAVGMEVYFSGMEVAWKCTSPAWKWEWKWH